MRVDNQIISLDPFLIQKSPNGKEFRVVGVEKDFSFEPQWINETEKFCWIVTVEFLEDGRRVQLYFDYSDLCVKKENFIRKLRVEGELLSSRSGTKTSGNRI